MDAAVERVDEVTEKFSDVGIRVCRTEKETSIVNQRFKDYIEDFSGSGQTGSLPGRKELQEQPEDFIGNMSMQQKVVKLHMKIFNERKKARERIRREENLLRK